MARYLVVEEGIAGHRVSHGPFDGLAVAKAIGQKLVAQVGFPVVIRDAETGDQLARFEAPSPEEQLRPSLARSVRRMRAANDRLKEALVPSAFTSGPTSSQTGRDKK